MQDLHTTLELLPTHLATMRLFRSYGDVVDVYLQEREAIGTPQFFHFIYADIDDPSHWAYARDCRFVGVIFEPMWRTPARPARSCL